jgi:transcriptional regulator with XRE-family HTH domain
MKSETKSIKYRSSLKELRKQPFFSKFKEERLKANMTLRELSAASGVSPAYIALIEGLNYTPSEEVATALKSALSLAKEMNSLGVPSFVQRWSV